MTNLLQSLSDNIVVDPEKCTGCGICVERCILDNLRLILPSCMAACPLEVNCQGYMKLIASGEEDKALEQMRETLPFPGILGRICSQPCEAECHRGVSGDGDALSIRALKRYLTEDIATESIPIPEIAAGSGSSVAIVGSGPAGLIAAYDLRVKGHEITVFDSEAEPGGMLRWAIPEFRLPVAVLRAEVDLLERLGIVFECGVTVGTHRTIENLKSEFDAIIVATGCGGWSVLNIPGEELDGVVHGLPFLHDTRAGLADDVGKRVVVIGGGNVAVDAAQTALRSGAESATVVCLESEEELPAFPWAVETAVFERIEFEHRWGPTRFVSKNGSVAGVELQRCVQAYDDNGAFAPRFAEDERRTIPADTVIVAVGQKRDTSFLTGTKVQENGRIHADALTLQTRDEKVFVSGDLLSGPSSAVEAMARGRDAAESVDRFLNGEHLKYGRTYLGPTTTEFEVEIRADLAKDRTVTPLRCYEGKGDFREIERGFTSEEARREARRCNSCGKPVGYYRTCWFCLPCEVECPEEALRVEVPYLLR